MTEMETFRNNARRLGLCDTYAKKWDDCHSKRQLFDLSCDINSLPYMAESICKGTGLTSDYIADEFGRFLNGRYIKKDGYTSCMYCKYTGEKITVETSAILVIDYNGVIEIPANRPCEIYFCNCNVNITGKGNGIAYLFNSNIANSEIAPVIIKENKKY